jgi:hypothetical protein
MLTQKSSLQVFAAMLFWSACGIVPALDGDRAYPLLDRSNSVVGPDIDGDGVRDDIQKWIDSLPDTPAQKAALRQEAKAERLILAAGEAGDKAQVRLLIIKRAAAVSCIYEKYSERIAGQKFDELHVNLKNTLARRKAGRNIDSLLSGGVYGSKGMSCE